MNTLDLLYIGAHRGAGAEAALARHQARTAVLIEPIPEFASECRQRFAGRPGVMVFKAAAVGFVRDEKDTVIRKTGPDLGSSSLYETNPAFTQRIAGSWPPGSFDPAGLEGTLTISVERLIDMLGPPRVMITDAQGADRALVAAAVATIAHDMVRPDLLPKIIRCEVDGQIPHYVGAPDNSLLRLQRLLLPLGYRQIDGPSLPWEQTPDTMQADVEFVLN
jgi:hypothetical protein